MATELWEQEIDKTVDWGGDTSTGGKAVSGQYVQKFIKDTLAQKFGYLHYDKDSLKYQVFADETDYLAWASDSATNSNLLLATFDAPAPATIQVEMISDLSNTILSSEINNTVKFKYVVTDSSSNPITEALTVRMQVTNGGISQTYTFSYDVDYDNYKTGTTQSIVIDDYLSTGTNNITLTFTGVSTQASSSLTLKYTVVELAITSTWDNTTAQTYNEASESPFSTEYDTSGNKIGNFINIPYIVSGQGSKYLEIYVNGKEFRQVGIKNGVGFGDLISSQETYQSQMYVFTTTSSGELNTEYFVDGKNTIQFRIYIDSDGRKIYSNTLYYDFVLKNQSSSEDMTYILYKQTLSGIFANEDTISFTAQQYFSTSFDYSIYSSTGKSVGLTFTLTKQPETEDDVAEVLATLSRTINSGEQQTFTYSFLTYGTINILIETDLQNNDGTPVDTLNVQVNVIEASVQIAVASTDRVLELSALNRSNSEPNPAVWSYESTSVKFNNIYWNDSSGWDGEALVLNNGANIEIPYNLFNKGNKDSIGSLGLTFEITFEMVNVQDEEAVMLSFEDEGSTSLFRLTASEALLRDNGGNELTTRYNSNTKVKLAFEILPWDSTKKWDPTYEGAKECKNALWMFINGILDKADVYSGDIVWTNPTDPKIVIGNTEGKAGIKLYSVRIYSKSLSMDEELTNFMAESDDILAINTKNDVYESGTSSVSLTLVKNLIPTVVLYGDLNRFNKMTNKKENMQFDMEFYDPTDSDRDFYARGLWMSNQGTSSLAYPIRNMRPYFAKPRDSKTIGEGDFYTEVYLAGEFTHGSVSDESTLGHFYTNLKTCADGYHKLYTENEAIRLESEGVQLFYKGADGSYYPCTKGVDDGESQDTWYIQSYREIKAYGETDDWWKFMKDLRLSGAKLYTAEKTTVKNPNSDTEYTINKFSKVKSSKALSKDKTYYLGQAVWRQYHKSGYTDRWTFKADYAESSMTCNAGVGRLWGDAMKNVRVSGSYVCRTDAQTAVGNLVTSDDERIDIRTSCDGKPIVMFSCPLLYETYDNDGNGVTPMYDENGNRKYGDPVFVGLYNIMTDKSSTKLFGFEDIYDENGNLIYKANKTECWECLTNANEYAMGLTVVSDEDQSNTTPQSRTFWNTYEARWPDLDTNGDAHTMHVESMWRFVNFCKPAVNYIIDGADGYELSNYKAVSDETIASLTDDQVKGTIYYSYEVESGNGEYNVIEASTVEDLLKYSGNIYIYDPSIDFSTSHKELSGKTIDGHIYKGSVACFDAKHGHYTEGCEWDEDRCDGETTSLGDAIAGSEHETDYYVDVFLTKNGSKYTYTDEFGKTATYAGTPDDYERTSSGESYSGKTYMDYFSDKKYDYFDVYRLAAYYIYLMRFAAADQFVKNTMMTSEDGQHFYFINYDNDTVLGVRNDGNMVFHWNIDRDSYDDEKSSFCLAGAKSVLWNLLEQDDDFMTIVQTVDNAMYTSNVLSADIALDMFNNKQEGSWGERMYNVNEQYKYLSQWTGDDGKYLKFIHGSANQFRSWFIENRFNYFDSLWESGDYLTSKITFRLDTTGANGTLPMFNITAARQNKFFLSNSDGLYKNVAAWKKTLSQDETTPWMALYSIYGNSSPWTLYGADKIGTLDFSVSTGIYDLQIMSFNEDNVNWVGRKGSLITKLLIGTSDEFRTSEMTRYINNTDRVLNFITSGIDPVQPGEYVDSGSDLAYDEITNPFIKEQLKKTQCNITSIGGLGLLYSLEEIDIRNCYNASGLLNDTLDLSGLSNLHIYRAIGSSITTFKPAQGVILYEVSLPSDRISEISLKDVTFKNANGIDNIFKYTPSYALKTLTLSNVTQEDKAFDIVEFIQTWMDAYEATGKSLKDLTLTLEGVDIRAPYSFICKLKELNLVSFTGDVFVDSDRGSDKTLTQTEYEYLDNLYSSERPWESSSALRFSANAANFWSITGYTYCDTNVSDNETTWGKNGISGVSKIYHFNQGETVKFKLTKLGSSESIVYGFKAIAVDTDNIKLSDQSFRLGTGNRVVLSGSPLSSISSPSYNFELTQKSSGYSELESKLYLNDLNASSLNYDRYVVIGETNDRGTSFSSDPDDLLFIKFDKVIIPEGIANLSFEGEDDEYNSFNEAEYDKKTNPYTLTRNKEYKFNIKYSNFDEVTAEYKIPTVTLGVYDNIGKAIYATEENETNKYGTISKVTRLSNDYNGSFIFTPIIQDNTTNVCIKVSIPYKLGNDYIDVFEEFTFEIKTIAPEKYIIGNPYIKDTGVEYLNTIEDSSITITESLVSEIRIPITFVDKDGIETNLSILNSVDDLSDLLDTSIQWGSNYLKDPTYEISDNKLFIDIKPNKITAITSYKVEGLLKSSTDNTTIQFGISKKDTEITLNIGLLFKVIYPDSFVISYDKSLILMSEDIDQDNNDSYSKIIKITLTPYNSKYEDSITISNVKYTVNPSIISDDNAYTLQVDYSDADVDGANYIINATLSASDTPTIEELVYQLDITGTFDYNLNGGTKTINDSKIITYKRSLGFSTDITNCLPYNVIKVNGVKSTLLTDWYLVDIDKVYYQFDYDNISTLVNAGKLNTLIGLAKRDCLGWNYPSTDNCENINVNNKYNHNAEGHDDGCALNNACLYWNDNPNINVDNEGEPIYCRAIAIPLANWKYDNDSIWITKGDTEGKLKTLNDYSAFFIPSSRLCGFESNAESTQIVNNRYGLTHFTTNSMDISTIANIFRNSTQEALHGLTGISGESNGVKPRITASLEYKSGIAESLPVQNTSMLDPQAATKYIVNQLNISNNLSALDNYIKNQTTSSTKVSNYNYSSGIINAWYHFNIFDNIVNESYDKIDKSTIDIHCYIPNYYELHRLFVHNNDDASNSDNSSNATVSNFTGEFENIINAMNECGIINDQMIKENNLFIKVFIDKYKDGFGYQNIIEDSGNVNRGLNTLSTIAVSYKVSGNDSPGLIVGSSNQVYGYGLIEYIMANGVMNLNNNSCNKSSSDNNYTYQANRWASEISYWLPMLLLD